MQDSRKAVWSIPYISAAFFPSLKENFIAYRSSKMSSRPDCIFEIHQLSKVWQSGISRVYSNCCWSCWFEREIIKIGQSSHQMYSNNIPNFQESTTILNACTKKVWKLIEYTKYISLLNYHFIKEEYSIFVAGFIYGGAHGCSRYRRRKWTRRHEFKSYTRLIAFHIALIPLGKVLIQLFSLQLCVNSRTD